MLLEFECNIDRIFSPNREFEFIYALCSAIGSADI